MRGFETNCICSTLAVAAPERTLLPNSMGSCTCFLLAKYVWGTYLGRLIAQDDDNIQSIHNQLWKAGATWARVGQIRRAENASPRVVAKFYKTVVQTVMLYGSKMWVLSKTALASLEGFHIRAAYRMARRYKPWRGQGHIGSTQSQRMCWKSGGLS